MLNLINFISIILICVSIILLARTISMQRKEINGLRIGILFLLEEEKKRNEEKMQNGRA